MSDTKKILKAVADGQKSLTRRIDKTDKMLRAVTNGQSSMKGELIVKIDKLEKETKSGFEKVHEEIDEVKEAENISSEELESEIGDLIFAVVNISRGYNIDPAVALQRTNNKFTKRFHFIEKEMKKAGKELNSDNFHLMDSFWDKAKKKK